MNNNARTTVERAIQSDDDTGLESVKNVGYMANADGEGGSGN
jgi:hypothetical protein